MRVVVIRSSIYESMHNGLVWHSQFAIRICSCICVDIHVPLCRARRRNKLIFLRFFLFLSLYFLCLFLFLVGLEIDSEIIRRNARLSLTVAVAGMAVPFGLGAALAVPLYHHFISSDVKYTHFMLFTGVAYSITAFPVLCRILTELKLLDTNVGVTVLSAGVIDDVVGWTLLALSVALVNAGSGLTCLWILLITIGWVIVLFVIFKPIMYWLARRTGSIENGPTITFMTITIFVMFGSAFFTDIIGVSLLYRL